MKTISIVGIILIILGVAALAYQGITYTEREENIDLGAVEFDVEQKETIPLPPVVGAAALVGGIVLLVIGKR